MAHDFDIPSLITPGKHFKVSVYKPQCGPSVATATEGTIDTSSPHFVGFSYILHSARMHRVKLVGNNTAKNRDVAVKQLRAELVEKGWIAA